MLYLFKTNLNDQLRFELDIFFLFTNLLYGFEKSIILYGYYANVVNMNELSFLEQFLSYIDKIYQHMPNPR